MSIKYKKSSFLLFIIFLLFFLSFNKITKADEFNRVKRQEFSLSLLTGTNLNVYQYSYSTYYYFTPYIYLMFQPKKDFEFNLYLPFDVNFEKIYKVETYYDENFNEHTRQYFVFNYYGGLSSPSIGIQYTFYTNTINDIYFNLSIPSGYFPMFYYRNNLDNSISNGYFNISSGINSSKITDPIILNYGAGLNLSFKPCSLYKEGNDFYYSLIFNGNIGYTEVLNYILSYFIHLKFNFILPEYKELFKVKDKEVYVFKIMLKAGFSIKISEDNSITLSISNSLTEGVLNPYFDIYFNLKLK